MSFGGSEILSPRNYLKYVFTDKGILKYIFRVKKLFESIISDDAEFDKNLFFKEKLSFIFRFTKNKIEKLFLKNEDFDEFEIKSNGFQLSNVMIGNNKRDLLKMIEEMKQASEILAFLESIHKNYFKECVSFLLARDITNNLFCNETIIDNYLYSISSVILENVILLIESILGKKSIDLDYDEIEQYKEIKFIIEKLLKMRETKKKSRGFSHQKIVL